MDRHPTCGVSGANRQMHLIASGLPGDIRSAYTTRRNVSDRKAGPDIKEDLFYFDHEPSRSKPFWSRSNHESEKNFLHLLERIDPQVCHTRATLGLLPVVARYCSENEKPFLFTLAHDFDLTLEHIPRLRRKSFHQSISQADAITSLTNEMSGIARQRFPGTEILTIKSGHRIPEPPFEKSSPPIVLWLGRLNAEWKRAQLFYQLAENLSGLPAEFIMIGPAASDSIGRDDGLARHFARKAEALPRFHFIPGVWPGEDEDWISKASILVNTSSHEGFPNTFIQSWLRETAVVSLKVDPDKLLSQSEMGRHSKGDFGLMTKQVLELIEKPDPDLTRRARDYAGEHHNIENTVAHYWDIYARWW